jgi:1-deoxy-D-xylulose-5-phosphate synthase
VRYPRGSGPGVQPSAELDTLPLGKAEVLRGGSNVALLAFGSMVGASLDIADVLGATLVNMRFVKPLDIELVRDMALRHSLIVTLEENSVQGGAGSAVAEAIHAMGVETNILQIGIPDRYIEHGARDDCLEVAGLDQANVLRQVRARIAALGLAPAVAGAVSHRSA